MKVRVYRNLRRNLYSIQTYFKGKGWRVVSHAESITLGNADFIVSDVGRERVRQKRRKNVHAFVIGTITTLHDPYGFYDVSSRVRYDPYEMETFEVDTGRDWEPITKANLVHITRNGVWAV